MTVATADDTLPRLAIGTVFSLGRMSEPAILALAAAAPSGSDDPVDQAAAESLTAGYPRVGLPAVDAGDFDPATTEHRYSLARVREFDVDGVASDVVVMRGDLASVLGRAKSGPNERSLVKRNASAASRHGWRPLAVAVAPVSVDDVVGDFRMEGFVTVRPESLGSVDAQTGPAPWVRVDVWSASLRIQHWSNVAVIFILSCTGYIIMNPFFGPSAYTGEPTGFLMGWVRFIHFAAAFCWLVIGATRVVSAFTSRDRYLRWPSMWPLKNKKDWGNLGRVVQHYAFIKEDAPLYLAHNPLQQLTYTAVYVGCALQLAAGFVLYSLHYPANPIWGFISTPIHWFGIPNVRMFHTGMMFALWMFVIAHVYLAFRADSLERHGGISSMINGGVWVRKGARPVDAPEVA